MLPPLPLDRFSPQARLKLEAATRHEVVRDPDAITARLRACGQPMFASAVDFERSFGGLVWGEDQLGLDYEEPMVDEYDPLRLDETHVYVGCVGVLGLYMNEAGEVIMQPNTKSSSVETFIEQYTLASSPLRYRLMVHPAPAAVLADALRLDPVPGAADEYQGWWESGTVRLRHFRQPEVDESRPDTVWAASLDAVFAVLEAARYNDPAVRVAVWGGAPHVRTCTDEEAGRLPSMESWATRAGAMRFGYGDEGHCRGVVWMLPRERRIEQYVQAHDRTGWRTWVSYGDDGEVTWERRD